MIKGKLYDCEGQGSCELCPNRKTCIFWQKDPKIVDSNLPFFVTQVVNDKGIFLTLVERKKDD